MRPPTAADIEALRDELEAEIHHGSEQRRKALAQAFIRLLVVEERDTIRPSYYVRGGLPPRQARRQQRNPLRRDGVSRHDTVTATKVHVSGLVVPASNNTNRSPTIAEPIIDLG